MIEASISSTRGEKVAILLCTYHGQHYLAEQLDSFWAQTHPNWEVWASDDGSCDDTHAILDAYSAKWGCERLSIHLGPAKGFVANFMALTCKAEIEAEYFAYSDQDDIWMPHKLERAVCWLKRVPDHIPALYCSRTLLVDAQNKSLGFSPLFSRAPCFANALVQSIAGGNTMVFNRAARTLIQNSAPYANRVPSHDWWAYLVVTACGGQVFYDPEPMLRYRQHGGNLVGANSTWFERLRRIRMLFGGRFRIWGDRHVEALSHLRSRMSPASREIFDRFVHARSAPLHARLYAMRAAGVYRQTYLGNLGLIAGVIFNKI